MRAIFTIGTISLFLLAPARGIAQPVMLPIPSIAQTFDLATLLEKIEVQAPVCITGQASFRGSARLPVGLNPDWKFADVTGTIDVPELKLNDFTLHNLHATIRLRDGVLSLVDLEAKPTAGERMRGSFNVGIFPAGMVNTSLNFEDLDVAYIAERLTFRSLLGLVGKANGTLQMSWPMGTPPTLDQVHLTLESPTLRFGKLTIGSPKVSLKPVLKGLEYVVDAACLGGKFRLQGAYPTPASIARNEEPADGHLELEHVEIDRIWQTLEWERPAENLFGILTADLIFRHEGLGHRAVGEGHLRISSLRWRDRVVSSGIGCVVKLADRVVQFSELKLGLGNGGSMSLRLDLQHPERSRLMMHLYRMPMERLLAVMSPHGVAMSDLPMDIAFDTTLGTLLQGSAMITMPRGKLFRIQVQEFRLPVRWSIVPGSRRGLVEIPDLDMTVAQGRMQVGLSYRFAMGGSSKLSGHIALVNVNGNSIIRVLSDTGPSVGGLTSGRIDFTADPLRTIHDLTGTIRLSSERLYLFQAPVFRDLSRMIGPNASPQTSLRRVELKAVVTRGFIRIQRFSCAAPTVQLFVDGMVSLDGRLRLGLTGSSGSQALRLALGPIVAASIPLSFNPLSALVVIQASRIIAQHTIQAEITGTLRSPSVQIRPLATLTEEGVRFFLDQGDLGVR